MASGLLAAGACRFERRPDLPSQAPPEDVVVRPGLSASPMEDSARAVALALDEALAVGDVSRVTRLTSADALLIDQEEGVHWTPALAEAALPRPLSTDRGLAWRLEITTFHAFPGSGLLVQEYRAVISGEGVPWRAVETLVLVRSDEGWRVAHLHRSRGLADSARR
jgi:ketosteroid isomerase-like protein